MYFHESFYTLISWSVLQLKEVMCQEVKGRYQEEIRSLFAISTEIGLKLCHVIFLFILRGIFLHMQMPLLEVIVLSEIRAVFSLLCDVVLHPYFNDTKLMQMFSLELCLFSLSLSLYLIYALFYMKKKKYKWDLFNISVVSLAYRYV